MKTISVLGSTGSIGTQTIDIAGCLGIKINCLAAGKNDKLLERQVRKTGAGYAAMSDETAAKRLKIGLADTNVKVFSGKEGVLELASVEADMSVIAVMGIDALLPALAAIDAGNDIGIANKESLVCAGELIKKKAKEKNVGILPIDSEHSAVFQCIQDKNSRSALKKIILTASGGPFFGKTRDELENITPLDALKHPNWAMGQKITIDSATMMNKGLELIEAVRLYDVKSEDIEIIIHRESIVHSMVEFSDGSILAQLSNPDMRLPIQYALTYPQRDACFIKPLDLTMVNKLTFYPPDEETFSCIGLAKYAVKEGGTMCTALNGANEAAVDMFLSGKIGFLDIAEKIENAMFKHSKIEDPTIDDILYTDMTAKNLVYGG